MKSDLHVIVSWSIGFLETGRRKGDSREFITTKQRILDRTVYIYHCVIGYMSCSLLR